MAVFSECNSRQKHGWLYSVLCIVTGYCILNSCGRDFLVLVMLYTFLIYWFANNVAVNFFLLFICFVNLHIL